MLPSGSSDPVRGGKLPARQNDRGELISIAAVAVDGYSFLSMKRVVWLVLAVFCAALVQVQPADGWGAKARRCSCCHSGACGMPGCCPPPAPAPVASSSAQAECVQSVPVPARAQAGRGAADNFYAAFVEATQVRAGLHTFAKAATAANVPLFKAHCSLLI